MDHPAISIQKSITRRFTLALLGLTLLAGCANQPPVAPRSAATQALIPPVKTQEPVHPG